MTQCLSELSFCPDIECLRSELGKLLTPFGTVRQLDIVQSCQSGRSLAMCFVRMASGEEEHQLARELGIGRFGGELVTVIELKQRPAANDAQLSLRAA